MPDTNAVEIDHVVNVDEVEKILGSEVGQKKPLQDECSKPWLVASYRGLYYPMKWGL